ncbi:hypothetical protein [Gorillibacterium sp. sgz5001074]|uniref:hypothetical protein n=1 Tax=Gorillibacterium sp. sgz5001074 TaxID=3446695 RepID=UPI003F676476
MRLVWVAALYAAASLAYLIMMDLLAGMSIRQSLRNLTSYFDMATMLEYVLFLVWAVLFLAAAGGWVFTKRLVRRFAGGSGTKRQ